MAEQDRADLAREVKVARLILKRENLSPPVPVFDVLKRHADVERIEMRFTSVDGLTYRKPDADRPKVILNTWQRNSNRERFTAAHELGHIILPWQVGNVSCHTDESLPADDSAYKQLEIEANQFAGELLVPSAWAEQQLIALGGTLAWRIFEVARIAQVSPIVAAFSASRIIHDAVLVITKDGTTMVNVFGSNLGQWARKAWSVQLENEYKCAGAACSSESFGPYQLHCVEFPPPSSKRPKQTSVEILDHIIFKVTREPKEQQRLAQKINGIIGSANSRAGSSTLRGIYVTLKLRFTDRPQISGVIGHPKFDEFLLAKAFELSERRSVR